jgi:hypothetical protein
MLALVQRWMSLPAWFICGLIAFWIAKDVILFLFTWRAYAVSCGRLRQWKTVCPLKREKVCGFMEIVDSLCSCIATTKKVTGTVKAYKPAIKTTDKSAGNRNDILTHCCFIILIDNPLSQTHSNRINFKISTIYT